MTHGWLGSFIEFLPLVEYLSNTYSEENLAVHLVVAQQGRYRLFKSPAAEGQVYGSRYGEFVRSVDGGPGVREEERGHVTQGGIRDAGWEIFGVS